MLSLGWNLCCIFIDGDYILYVDVFELMFIYDLLVNYEYFGLVLWLFVGKLLIWWDLLLIDWLIVYVILGMFGGRNLL